MQASPPSSSTDGEQTASARRGGPRLGPRQIAVLSPRGRQGRAKGGTGETMSGMATRGVKFPRGDETWTVEQANALLRAVEDMFHRVDIEALVHGFTDDCVVRFAEQPERRGRDVLRTFFTAR